MMKENNLQGNIRRLAETLGIDVVGFAKTSAFENYMLADSKRREPRLSLADAKTIIVAGIYIGGFTLPSWDKPHIGKTSRLYLSGFFNDMVKPLEPIATLLENEGYIALVCDESREGGSILPLKLAAVRAGLGWQGKNSLLVTKKYGTFLALGGILTNANLGHSTEEETNLCENCRRCQQACPLGALEQAYVLKKSKCLSYLLQSDNFPEEAKMVVENRVLDCEICQQVCPWNAKHIRHPLATAATTSFQKELQSWEDFFTLPRLARLTEREYDEVLGHLHAYIPYPIFHRNVLMAMEWLQRG